MKIRKIRLFLIIFWFIIAGLFIWLKVLPFGHAVYFQSYPDKFNLSGGKGFIGRFSPAERVTLPNKIIGDPVYFSIFTPRTFSEVKLTITYRPTLTKQTPIIEAGVLVDNVLWRYKTQPLQNDILDNNFKDWFRLSSGNTVLLQKNKIFNDIPSALQALDKGFKDYCNQPTTCLAWYNADDLSVKLPLNITSSPREFKIINTPLQGAHQFYFLNDKKGLANFSLDFADLNINRDADNVEISIYNNSKKIYSQVVTDNFGQELSNKVREFNVNFNTDLTGPTNLYKLEVKANDDIVIKVIKDAPSALLAIGHLRPVASPLKPLSFWTDSSYIEINAVTPASRQTILFGGQDFKVTEAYQPFEFLNDKKGLKEVRLNKDDVILENNSVFSFAPEDFFNPNLIQLDRHFTLDNNIKFILANYQTPLQLENGYKQATVILNTKEAYREKGKYGFIISVPGLSLASEGSLEIKSIKAEFTGRTIFDKLLEIF